MTNEKFEARRTVFTTSDLSGEQYYDGKLCVLSLNSLKDDYKSPQNQIIKVSGGFGCDPTKIGTKVFGRYIVDGEETALRRSGILGVLKNEVANELGLCPCGKNLHEDEVMNALSRKDNRTYICKSCEGKELQEELDKLELEG